MSSSNNNNNNNPKKTLFELNKEYQRCLNENIYDKFFKDQKVTNEDSKACDHIYAKMNEFKDFKEFEEAFQDHLKSVKSSDETQGKKERNNKK